MIHYKFQICNTFTEIGENTYIRRDVDYEAKLNFYL